MPNLHACARQEQREPSAAVQYELKMEPMSRAYSASVRGACAAIICSRPRSCAHTEAARDLRGGALRAEAEAVRLSPIARHAELLARPEDVADAVGSVVRLLAPPEEHGQDGRGHTRSHAWGATTGARKRISSIEVLQYWLPRL